MKGFKIFYIACFLIIMFASCNRHPDYLEQSLELAGDNRSELEKVLLYYQQDSVDSFKYRAAVFLISNMSANYSYTGEGMEKYYDALASISLQYKGAEWANEEAENAFKVFSKTDFRHPAVVSDLQVINVDYLIDNINCAFTDWQNLHWLKEMEFDEFCEFLLPYKVEECQTLDNWWEYLSDIRFGDFIKL
ncbi:MAG: hypothetical protein LBS04_02490 [Tannerellaceae bacterium]|nr:hypothetical protein [Tannerellaceae bacterium]